MLFDVKKYLEKCGIEVKDSTKWWNVNCPFCVSKQRHLPDYEHLLGISKQSGIFKCLRCDRRGNLFQILNSLTGISREDYKVLSGQDLYTEEDLLSQVQNMLNANKPIKDVEKIKNNNTSIDIPGIIINEHTVEIYPELHAYLNKRNISIETCKKYGATYCGMGSKYANRIVLPIYKNNIPVCFQARSIFDDVKKKYDTPYGVDLKSYIYTTDIDITKPVYIVEGIFDAWRMNSNTVATFGKMISKKQIQTLLDMEVKTVILTYDLDAMAENIKFRAELSCFFEIGMVLLNGKDPDVLGEEHVKSLPIKWL